jgi:hypothetical protein
VCQEQAVKTTRFERAVVALIYHHRTNNSISGWELRELLLKAGIGKHPAAVAMNLTRLACKNGTVGCFIKNDRDRYFLLTSDGEDLGYQLSKRTFKEVFDDC